MEWQSDGSQWSVVFGLWSLVLGLGSLVLGPGLQLLTTSLAKTKNLRPKAKDHSLLTTDFSVVYPAESIGVDECPLRA